MRWNPLLIRLSLLICLIGFATNEVLAQDADAANKATAEELATDGVDDQKTDEDQYSQMSLEDLAKDFSSKMKDYIRRYRNAPKAEKLQVSKSIPTVKIYQSRLFEMVNADPGSDAALEVIDWWYRRGKSNSGDVITRLILKNYSKLATIEKYVPQVLWHLPKDEAEEQFRMLLEVNPSDSVKGSASYLLQYLLTEKAKKYSGEKAEAILAEVKTLRTEVREKYPNATNAGGATYASLIDAEEFAEKLEIGKPVPDIVGTDLDGVEFKLSDYDDKVRVISYWGDW